LSTMIALTRDAISDMIISFLIYLISLFCGAKVSILIPITSKMCFKF